MKNDKYHPFGDDFFTDMSCIDLNPDTIDFCQTTNPTADPTIRGTHIHRVLEWLAHECSYQPQNLTAIPKKLHQFSLQQQINTADQQRLQQLWSKGSFIFNSPGLQEVECTFQEKLYRIDRIFYDHNMLWIVDYKTGQKNDTYHAQLYDYYHIINTIIARNYGSMHTYRLAFLWIDHMHLDYIDIPISDDF